MKILKDLFSGRNYSGTSSPSDEHLPRSVEPISELTENTSDPEATVVPGRSTLELAREFLNQDLIEQITVQYPDRDGIYRKHMQSDIARLWSTIPNGHKWLNYFDCYEKLFSDRRNTPVRMLEIGVNKGGSLELWRQYLGAQATIVGVDIAEECRQYENVDAGVFVRIGDQADNTFLQGLIDEFGPFDLVLDDGSHIVSHQVASFNALFATGLRDGGCYVVEDLETSHWGHATGQNDIPITFHDFVAGLVDLMHEAYKTRQYHDFEIDTVVETPMALPRISTMIEEIRTFDSMVAIYKGTVIPPVVENLDKTFA